MGYFCPPECVSDPADQNECGSMWIRMNNTQDSSTLNTSKTDVHYQFIIMKDYNARRTLFPFLEKLITRQDLSSVVSMVWVKSPGRTPRGGPRTRRRWPWRCPAGRSRQTWWWAHGWTSCSCCCSVQSPIRWSLQNVNSGNQCFLSVIRIKISHPETQKWSQRKEKNLDKIQTPPLIYSHLKGTVQQDVSSWK